MDEGGYGRFAALSRQELERYCYLDDKDRALIAARRRDYNRLGFAVQVVTVRNLGMFLADPVDVPAELVQYLAEQLGIDDPSCVEQYTERRMTRFEHQTEIQQEYGISPFAEVKAELVAWIADQAWTTGDGPKTIFAGAVEWLRERPALLPGITTLDALVAEGRAAADKRLWEQVAGRVGPGTASALMRWLDIPEDANPRISDLERLRKGAFRASWKGVVKALRRLEDVQAVGIGAVDLSMVPPRRLTGLATYGLAGKASALRRLEPRSQRVAVLAATAKAMLARAVDDVLEVFDLLMTTQLLDRAERQGGFYLDGRTVAGLRDGQASEVIKRDGSIAIGQRGRDVTMTPDVVGVRQNLVLLVDNGQVVSAVDSSDHNLWGVTVDNRYFVWRSGVGITADGNIVYAMGPALSVRTLAELLHRAGAVRAMELDINTEWVSFMTYDSIRDPINPPATKLLPEFRQNGGRNFNTDERDFVAVYSR